MVVGIRTTHTDELVPTDAEHLRIAAHVLSKEVFSEVVVTCRNRSVYGIKGRSTDNLESLVECQAFANVVAKTLQVAECGMTLVAMINILLDAKLLEQQHTADTEQNLLL